MNVNPHTFTFLRTVYAQLGEQYAPNQRDVILTSTYDRNITPTAKPPFSWSDMSMSPDVIFSKWRMQNRKQ